MALAIAAIDAYEYCSQASTLTSGDLAPLVAAAASAHKLVFETGASLLAALAETRVEAQQSFRQLSECRGVTARFHAVAYLSSRMPESLRLEIVTRALTDKSPRVREKGIEQAEQFGFKQLLPHLEEMERCENHGGVLASLQLHLPLLRDGYWLRPCDGEGDYQLSVRCDNGDVVSVFIAAEDYSDAFVRKEIARLQKQWP